jgi:hypothetical protein
MNKSNFSDAFTQLIGVVGKIIDVAYYYHDMGTEEYKNASILADNLSKFKKLHNHEKIDDDFKMKSLNMFYKKHRENIIKSLSDPKYDWLDREKVYFSYINSNGKGGTVEIKLMLSSVYHLANGLMKESETTGKDDDNKKFPDRLMLALYYLLYTSSISNNEETVLAKKITELQKTLGLEENIDEKQYGPMAILGMLMNGELMKNVKGMFNEENLEMVKDASKTFLGDTEIIDMVENKFREHGGDIFSLGKELINNPETVRDFSSKTMEKLGEIEGFKEAEKGVNVVLETLGVTNKNENGLETNGTMDRIKEGFSNMMDSITGKDETLDESFEQLNM